MPESSELARRPARGERSAHAARAPTAASPIAAQLNSAPTVQKLHGAGRLLNRRGSSQHSTPINDDRGLETEADRMGARAAALGGAARPDALAPPAPPPPPPPPGGAPPVQRYQVVGKTHISDDHTAAVVDEKNNKQFYATHERLAEANQALDQRLSNIHLTKGSQAIAYDNERLLETLPVLHTKNIQENKVPGAFNPVKDTSDTTKTGVHLPSECEKGAIAIIGAFVEDRRQPDNAFVYHRKDHGNARIANLIAQSPAGAGQKQQWYDEWVRLNRLHGLAVAGFESAASEEPLSRADIDLVRAEVRTTRAGIADAGFDQNFAAAQNSYVMRTSKVESARLVKEMVRDLDDKINAVERTVMSSVDATYRGLEQNVLEAKDLRARLVQLYGAHDFPKATVDAALDMAKEKARLDTYFAPKPGEQGVYVNDLNFFSDSRMRSFLESLVQAIDVEILKREKERNRRFGTGAAANEAVDPEIGEAYGIIGGHYSFDGGGRWNWHWAGVILKTATDNVTMEAHASHKVGNETHNENWDFKMYGRPGAQGSAGKTFHEVWRDAGFGQAPVTMLGQASLDDPRVARFGLDGLSLAQVETYKTGALDLFGIMRRLEDMTIPRAEVLRRYDENLGVMHEITENELPGQFVLGFLKDDLTRQGDAVEALREAGEEQAQLDLEVVIADAATDVRAELSALYVALESYRRHARKLGRQD